MKKYAVLIVSVFVCGMILFAFVPGLIGATVKTTTLTNDGAGWERFNYVSGSWSYEVRFNHDAGAIRVTGGGVQSGSDSDSILYADSNVALYVYDGTMYLAGESWEEMEGNEVTVRRTNTQVTVADSQDAYTFSTPEWAYVPNANGNYAFYENGTETHRSTATPIAAVGHSDVVSAYNDMVSVPNLLTMTYDGGDDYLKDVVWIHRSGSTPADPVDAIGFIAPVTYTESHLGMDSAFIMIRLIPLMFLIGVVIYFIHKINNRNDNFGGMR